VDHTPPPPTILLFDGVCNLCNRSIDWLIRHDPHAALRFAPQQSSGGQRLLAAHGLGPAPASVVAIAGDEVLTESAAVLHALSRLPEPWPDVAALGSTIPAPLRDALYRFVAARRYALFGRRETCRVPSEQERVRFVES